VLQQMVSFFVSGFVYSGLSWAKILVGIGLAVAFGAIWLAGYRPPLVKKRWLWAVLAISAFLTWVAVSFIQIPLQFWAGQSLGHFWSQEVIMRRLLLFGIPQILLSGLVQEGSKLVPIVIYWRRQGRSIDPKLGLVIGAVAGAGLGIFEAVWAHNLVFLSGWSWQAVQTQGLVALAPFGERFFVVAAHTAFSALAGYGLAKGRGWQFYLIASGLHALINYSVVLLQTGVLSLIQVEIYVAIVALSVTAWALWLRWRKPAVSMESEV
jgi:RsiW-degrading membrane proteinase PrsW (M82 family)